MRSLRSPPGIHWTRFPWEIPGKCLLYEIPVQDPCTRSPWEIPVQDSSATSPWGSPMRDSPSDVPGRSPREDPHVRSPRRDPSGNIPCTRSPREIPYWIFPRGGSSTGDLPQTRPPAPPHTRSQCQIPQTRSPWEIPVWDPSARSSVRDPCMRSLGRFPEEIHPL